MKWSSPVLMECLTPHCAGRLRTGPSSGFCPVCHLPVSACSHCHAWNRAFAVFCRHCGRAGSVWQTTDPVDPEALRSEPRRTVIPQPVTTAAQAIAGFLWTLGEGGDLYRLNPYAPSGEQVQVHDRFWAESQPHAFCVRRLRAPFANATQAPVRPPYEHCAVIATADRLLISGLYSRQRRSFQPLPGETFLVNSRDEYQFVAADEGSAYLLSRHGEQIHLCEARLTGGEIVRLPVAPAAAALSGPVLVPDRNTSHVVIWSASALWIHADGALKSLALPEAVELRSSSVEAGLRVPPGRSPAIVAPGQLFLAATQFGRPALLRLAFGPTGWSATVIAVTDEGALGQTTAGQPLLSTAGRLLGCTGAAFRTLVQDNQIATRFPAWAHDGLSVICCEADYQGLKQWLKAYLQGSELPISWNQPFGAEVHACDGFWTEGTALCTVCVLAERALRTEFISWCV